MDCLFCGEINETKTLHNVLKAINFKEYALIRIMEEGFKVTVEDVKSIQTSAYIPSDVFNNYKLSSSSDEPEKFKISLKLFTEFLNIFGDDQNHILKIIYKSIGSPLSLLITHTEENIIVDCEIMTMQPDDIPELVVPEVESINNIIVQAVPFMNRLSDLDTSSDILEIYTSPDPPYFLISTIGTMGDTQIEISKYSEIIESFSCTETIASKYMYNILKQLLKVMGLANKVSISTSPDGVLGVQVIVNCDSETKIYVEYFITALLNDD